MTSLDRRNDVSHKEAAAPGEVRRWRAFAVLAVAYFMTIVDLKIGRASCRERVLRLV